MLFYAINANAKLAGHLFTGNPVILLDQLNDFLSIIRGRLRGSFRGSGYLVDCCEHGADERAAEVDEGAGDATWDADVHYCSWFLVLGFGGSKINNRAVSIVVLPIALQESCRWVKSRYRRRCGAVWRPWRPEGSAWAGILP